MMQSLSRRRYELKRQCNVKKLINECYHFVTSSFQGQIIFSIENFGASANHTLHKLTAFVEAVFFLLRIKYICPHQSDHDCNDVCMNLVARKEPRFLHLFTTLLLNRKYNPLPPIYYCKSDTFSVHCFIFLEKLFVGSSLKKESILDYFWSKFWRTDTPQKSA